MAVKAKDRKALQDAVYDFINQWMKRHNIHLTGDEIGKMLDMLSTRFVNEYHLERKLRGANKRGEYL